MYCQLIRKIDIFIADTTPPKKQIKDMSQDFYSAGFAPGAIVYFSYDQPKGADDIPAPTSFLKEDVMSLKCLELIAEEVKPEINQGTADPVAVAAPAQVEERKPATDKKANKPKWFKM